MVADGWLDEEKHHSEDRWYNLRSRKGKIREIINDRVTHHLQSVYNKDWTCKGRENLKALVRWKCKIDIADIA